MESSENQEMMIRRKMEKLRSELDEMILTSSQDKILKKSQALDAVILRYIKMTCSKKD
ncbi:MAG TPA: hypothetical protein VIO64_09120 [Pseudobacteroides sp.]|uniref:hypothetical protein n=1 Tax=Pseudobacteroides sp. TaxID=1968840 RepID=UPI002F92E2DF